MIFVFLLLAHSCQFVLLTIVFDFVTVNTLVLELRYVNYTSFYSMYCRLYLHFLVYIYACICIYIYMYVYIYINSKKYVRDTLIPTILLKNATFRSS